MDENFRTVKEIADTYKLTSETLLRWIKDGDLEAIRVGGQYRISDTNWEKYLTQQQASAAS